MADQQAYKQSEIQRYLQQKMTPQEMHDFEKALMDDPFLADAVEGYKSANNFLSQKHLVEIQSELTGGNEDAKLVSMTKRETAWWKVAAVVLVLAAGGILTNSLLKNNNSERNISQVNNSKEIRQEAKTDSVGPADKPLAKVDNFPKKELVEERKSEAPLIRPEAATKSSLRKSRIEANIVANTPGSGNAESATVSRADSNIAATSIMSSKVAPADPGAAEGRIASAALSDMQTKAAVVDTNERGTKFRKIDSLANPRTITFDTGHIRERTTNGPEPAIGWQAFESYLDNQLDELALVEESKTPEYVRVEFIIDEQGSPTQIRVTESQQAITAKIIGIIKDGPKWKGKNDEKVSLLISL